jgi:hypothetical protein
MIPVSDFNSLLCFPCCWSVIGKARGIEKDASSESCVSLMRSWISDCLSKHEWCKSLADALLPDRVVDIRPGRNPFLHLNDGGETGIYAALSHCWGGQVSLTLLEQNLHDLQQGIPFESFPKTFRHAVEVCRFLGIPYLWIDSLCIIQDSEDDWAVQGSKMDEVYSRCHLAIAADGARDSKDGFLRDPRRRVPVIKIQCPQESFDASNSGSNGSTDGTYVYVRKKGAGNLDTFMRHTWSAEYRSRLSTRGWVLQESVLAPRILHFTAEELSWECGTISRCECQVAPHVFTHETPMKLRLPPLLDHAAHWATLVQEFTCRDLTYPSDRLPAISGLAARMQPADSAVAYYAGLWSDSLPKSLMWICIDHNPDLPVAKRVSKRIRPLSAPTWSWASITGRIVFGGDLPGGTNLEDVQVTCSLFSRNKYGTVSSATLTANALVVHGRLARHPDQQHRKGSFQVQVIHPEGEASDPPAPEGEVFPDVVGDVEEVRDGDDIILVDPVGQNALGFLVLRPVEGAPETYERVGMFINGRRPMGYQLGRRQRIAII